jgi:Fe-S cluster biogenesis protein NfuA
MIRPTIQADDGDVELVEVTEDGVVRLRFLGACVGCPSSSQTLQVGIEKVLKEHIPRVREVQAVA